jgi:hypothetical protein
MSTTTPCRRAANCNPHREPPQRALGWDAWATCWMINLRRQWLNWTTSRVTRGGRRRNGGEKASLPLKKHI